MVTSAVETGGKRVENATQWSRMWPLSAGMFVLLCILVWLNEVLDLPHLLLGAPRTPINWQEATIETVLVLAIGLFTVLRLIHDITGRKRAEERIEYLNLVLCAIRNVNQLIVRESDRDRLLQGACDCLVKTRYYNAWIAILDEAGDLVMTAEAGLGKEFLPIVERLERGELTGCARRALAQAGVLVTKDTLSTCPDCPLSGTYAGRGAMTVRLECGGKIYGLLTVSSLADPAVAEAEQALLEEVAGDIAFALNSIGLEGERKRAEEALWEGEARYRLLAENVTDVIWIMDMNLRYTYISPSAARMSGYSLEEVMALTVEDVLTPASLEVVMKAFAEEMAVEEMEQKDLSRSVTLELEQYCKDGSTIWTEVKVTGLRDPDGRLVGILGITRDATGRKRAEEALRESEEQLRALIDAMPDFVCFKDGDGRWLEINGAGIRLFQLEGVDYWGKKDSELAELCSSLRDTFLTCKKTDARTWERRVLSRREEMIPRPDGTVRVYDVIKVPLFFPDGERKGLVVLGHDITERKRAEEERARLLVQIQEQAQQVQQIVDTMPEGVLLLDADAQVILANPVAGKDLLVLADARIGDTLTRLGDRPLAELLTSPPKGLWHEVTTGSVGDRAERRFEIIARPLETGPMPESWVLVIRDVTREREIQRYSQQQERLATVGQLAAGIAHDFNNIMATIVLYAQMMLRAEGLPTRDRERLATIDRQAKHATNLTQQILDFSRRAMLERRPLDLALLLKEQVKLLERTLPENIEIGLAYGPDEYTINADPTRMQQVVMNLALNVRDAMPQGGNLRFGLERIRIEASREAPLPGVGVGEWIQVTVSDTGTGIPPDVLPHIFDPFFTTKGPGEGSGLGLAQVHGIVKQHEGEIDVQSQMGQGTTFTIYLPALPVHPAEAVTLELPALLKGQGETILVVEDNWTTRKVLVESLELLNYRALEAADGRGALAILERHDDDPSTGSGQGVVLVLSDVVMPGMGGVALLHALRQMGLAVPVVMLTGHSLERELEELRSQGMSDWLPKPPSLEQLAQVVARALGKTDEVR